MRIKASLKKHEDFLNEGETLRLNHEDCPAGEDTRRRLYITKKPQVMLGYCHNCQSSSSLYIAAKDRFKPLHKDYNKPVEDREFSYPSMEEITPHSPADVTLWRQRYNMTNEWCKYWGIRYVPDSQSIFIPVLTVEGISGYSRERDILGAYNGYQLRPLSGSGAKYITCLEDERIPMGGFLRKKDLLFKRAATVIVEDYISAIHIIEAGYFSVCNYGVQIKPEILNLLPQGKPIHIWLDNDSEHVKKKARDMQGVCQLLGYDTHLCKSPKEPKELDYEQIRRML